MGKSRILIVDDEELVVQGIKKNLESDDYNVETIIGGKEAIEHVKKSFFDIVIVDLVMPGLNGVDTCKGIKKVSPKTAVVLLSGFPGEVEKLLGDFLEAGGEDLYLRKPLYDQEIGETIGKLLANREKAEKEPL